MIFTALTHFATFFIGGGFKNKRKIIDFVFFCLTIVLSMIFYIFKIIPIEVMCIMWGAYDIIRNIAHIVSSSMEVRENKLEIIEMIAAVMEIIFSILLIFERAEGVTLHLIVMAIAYTIFGIKFSIDYAIEEKHKKHEEPKKE